ncbi:D-alanyl-D-alanine carboxypeptidase [Streptomyces sp. NPDC049541]|uniref:D-alanyl-D-alanine carboxypeptidase n=1 Tax=Streptomyces sp. NPDC049541 TaxID=3365594 RepID=UPI0037AA3628
MEEASVAGESPDRSKQRESSAEPTSGNTGPVPEPARDPRLSVSREPDSTDTSEAHGGVDTATRVFSVRDLKTAVEKAGETAAEESTAEQPETAEAGAGAAEAGAGGMAAGAAEAGARGAAEGPEAGEPGTAEIEVGKAAPAESVVTRPRAEGAGAEEPGSAEAGAGAAVAGARGAAAGSEGEESVGEGPAAEESGPAEAGVGKPGAGGVAEGEESAVAGTADEEPGAVGADDSDGEHAAAGRVDAASAGGDSADATATSKGDATGDARLRAAVAAWVRSGDSKDSEEPESAETAAEADEDGAAEAEAEAGAGADSDVEDGAPADSRVAEAEDGPEDAVPQPQSESEAGDEPETGGAAETAGAADGEEAPKGPPAPEDESGSAGGEDKPVDQPTAIFKRPKPQVDQPTTMLKLGGAKTAEPSEAERTSKFVALKPLDEPRTPRRPADATAPVPQVGPERTAQQPLPPKPPLDLLAELTNTPPPPQTPVRTIIRRVKIWTPLVLLLAIVFAIVQSVRPLPTPTLALTADDSYTFAGTKAGLPWPNEGQGWMDVNGIGTMGNFGKQTPVPIGSVAKAMTAYIVLKDHPLKPGEEGKKIKVDALAEKEGGYYKQHESTLNTVKEGDVLTEKQALSAIMIPSANNIARLLARWDMGSEAAFIKKMNDTAKGLGMKNTTYTDASGLKESTVSTAEDQVKLGHELVKIPALMDITKLPSWIDPSGKKWDNYNGLVPFDGAIGIKTGTTTKAGGNLLFAATKEVGGETVTVVGAILDQQTAPIIDTVVHASRTAMLAARDALTSTKILKKGDVVGYVDDQLGGHTPIVLTKDVAAVGWAGLKVNLSFDSDAVPHTAKAGTKVGTLTVGDGTSGAVKVPVALQKDLTEPGFTAKLKRLG